MLNVTVVSLPAIVAVAVVVCVPINIPSVRNVCACPFASVVDVAGSTDPPPDAAAHVTVTPATGLPFASLTSTMCGVCRRVATCPVRLSPELFAIVAAGPAVPVAVKVTGLPVRPFDVAVSVFGPAVALRVQEVSAAIPSVPVLTGVAGVTVPLPAAGVNVTATCATGLLLASFTITEGGGLTAVPAVADVPPAFRAIVAAAPAVIVIVVDVADVSPVAVKLKVRSPAAPVIARSEERGVAHPFVVALSVPPSVPPPVAIAAVTVTWAWLTALPLASRSCTPGCWANATPLGAVLEGWVVRLNWVAAPAVIVIVVEVADVSPVAVKLKVRSPVAPVIARLVERESPRLFFGATCVSCTLACS